MRNIGLLYAFLCAMFTDAAAQSTRKYTPQQKNKYSYNINGVDTTDPVFITRADSGSLYLKKVRPGNIPGYRMPLAPLPGSMQPLIYKGNDGNGFDIYQSPQDNMHVLRPDSTFSSRMPVKKMIPADSGEIFRVPERKKPN